MECLIYHWSLGLYNEWCYNKVPLPYSAEECGCFCGSLPSQLAVQTCIWPTYKLAQGNGGLIKLPLNSVHRCLFTSMEAESSFQYLVVLEACSVTALKSRSWWQMTRVRGEESPESPVCYKFLLELFCGIWPSCDIMGSFFNSYIFVKLSLRLWDVMGLFQINEKWVSILANFFQKISNVYLEMFFHPTLPTTLWRKVWFRSLQLVSKPGHWRLQSLSVVILLSLAAVYG